MKQILIIILSLNWVLTSFAQESNNHILLDGFTAAKVSEKSWVYNQTGFRMLASSPTGLKNVNIAAEAFVVDQGFAQGLIGLEFRIAKILYFTTLVGIANTPQNPLRLGTSLHLRHHKLEALTVYQWCPQSDYFYVGKLAYRLNKISLGIRSQRFLNTGVYVDYSISRHLTLWTQAGHNFEVKGQSIAIGLTSLF